MVWAIDILEMLFDLISGIGDWLFKPINVMGWNGTPVDIVFYSMGALLVAMFIKKVVPVA